IVISPPARHPILWYFYFEHSTPKILKKINPDLYLSPDGWMPLDSPYKTVNVIHDLNFAHYPEFIKPVFHKYYNHYFPKFATQATRIATVSEYTKHDIHALYHIPLKKIDVVYNGANQDFKPLLEREKQAVRGQHTQGNPYFLFVGMISKRKNLDNIFRAFDLFKLNEGNSRFKLVVIGERKWWKGDIADAYAVMQHKEDVVFLGRVGRQVLSELMGTATALLYPSLFEGFGIPIIEAFQSGVPVITSNITSMPEVAGDAALLVNPYSVEEITEAMNSVISDDELVKSLIINGNKRKEKFSWEITADKLWDTVEKVLFE
ncbi:MAG: glycosyltransferase family 4 protein, partial [Bacteroidales bacterium]|nr:glycosyltransferase family 4 protein [Bacteroidales bacterium]